MIFAYFIKHIEHLPQNNPPPPKKNKLKQNKKPKNQNKPKIKHFRFRKKGFFGPVRFNDKRLGHHQG